MSCDVTTDQEVGSSSLPGRAKLFSKLVNTGQFSIGPE